MTKSELEQEIQRLKQYIVEQNVTIWELEQENAKLIKRLSRGG